MDEAMRRRRIEEAIIAPVVTELGKLWWGAELPPEALQGAANIWGFGFACGQGAGSELTLCSDPRGVAEQIVRAFQEKKPSPEPHA